MARYTAPPVRVTSSPPTGAPPISCAPRSPRSGSGPELSCADATHDTGSGADPEGPPERPGPGCGTRVALTVTGDDPRVVPELVRAHAPKLTDLSDDVLFADVWQRPGRSPRHRSLIAVAALAALGREAQPAGHLRRAGLSPDEVAQADSQEQARAERATGRGGRVVAAPRLRRAGRSGLLNGRSLREGPVRRSFTRSSE
ncbi:carboxymuconolactone decarboxylase family protein [Streptomyces spiralis]